MLKSHGSFQIVYAVFCQYSVLSVQTRAAAEEIELCWRIIA